MRLIYTNTSRSLKGIHKCLLSVSIQAVRLNPKCRGASESDESIVAVLLFYFHRFDLILTAMAKRHGKECL